MGNSQGCAVGSVFCTDGRGCEENMQMMNARPQLEHIYTGWLGEGEEDNEEWMDPAVTVGVDIDDTLIQTVNTFRTWSDSENGRPLCSTWSEYQRVLGDTSNPWRQAFVQSGLMKEVPLVPGARKGLSMLKAAGFRLEAVTARPKSMSGETMELLDHLFPGMLSRVHFTGDALLGSPGSKGTTCRCNGIRVLIDDGLQHLEDSIRYGVLGILFDHKGMYGLSQHTPSGITRFESWEQISQWLIERREWLMLDSACC
eukprot:gnl/MRDRNA2_/MRDRNA2_80490_c0_seq1.p1 gnl/MRDRNA2_/MRDRNA2_80490_c0~~gnl/MRDRNA2_/MRDRNA2_80490_c0_seq1.p1  ORF type:complete len:280 (+),score=39.29 gnl/MRDRNA2_/MRDRNA2_80490_c0_seq1:75-842(+)